MKREEIGAALDLLTIAERVPFLLRAEHEKLARAKAVLEPHFQELFSKEKAPTGA